MAKDFTAQVKDAIANKPITRRTPSKGQFSSPAKASGDLIESIRTEFDDDGFSVLCSWYIMTLIYGIEPKKARPPISVIEKWIQDKGLDISPWAVFYGIYNNGSSIWQEHKGADSGLLSDVNIEARIEEVKRQLVLKQFDEISSEIYSLFQAA